MNEKYRYCLWEPILHIHEAVSYEHLLAYYQIADVALVTPLRDGMNLVAKEYLLAKGEDSALILSKTAGCSTELADAYLVDPNEIPEIVELPLIASRQTAASSP